MILKYLTTEVVWELTNLNKCWHFKLAGTGQLSALNPPYYCSEKQEQ